MKRTTAWLGAIGILALTANIVLADDTTTPPPGAGSTDQTQTPSTQPAPSTPTDPGAATPPPAAQPDPNSAPATPAAQPATDAAAKAPEAAKKSDAAKVTQKASAALDAVSKDVEKAAATDGDQKFAERLASEFGGAPDALIAEKKDLQTGWGSILLAHTLVANAATPLTPKQVLDQRTSGKSWGLVVEESGLLLGSFVKAAREEARVAKGAAKPDGQVAMAFGTGSKFGLTPPAKPKKVKAAKADAPKAGADKAAEGSQGGSQGDSK